MILSFLTWVQGYVILIIENDFLFQNFLNKLVNWKCYKAFSVYQINTSFLWKVFHLIFKRCLKQYYDAFCFWFNFLCDLMK